jgi:hypothetical protein
VDIDKACEWLKENVKFYSFPKYKGEDLTDETYISDNLFNDFREAMKEEKVYNANKVEPKFHEGEWIVTDKGDTVQIVAVNNGNYTLYNRMKFGISYVDKFWHKWTIADAKAGDLLYSPRLRLLWIFKSKDTVYCGYNLNYNDGAFCGEAYFKMPTDATPATKEQRYQLEKVMTDAGYRWNKEKLKLEKI